MWNLRGFEGSLAARAWTVHHQPTKRHAKCVRQAMSQNRATRNILHATKSKTATTGKPQPADRSRVPTPAMWAAKSASKKQNAKPRSRMSNAEPGTPVLQKAVDTMDNDTASKATAR
eukprot:CAMPEP_0172823324 /NCGR_PEP_ID=MMETSP1075-20121228/17249_1 /TAXON_ID=2916 /ORGANISM="Ceratium fusus, Strain PA161109" /LENGTH=116 /DNA_ID=CAMNT_0013664439 /DNA_START=165 /DNA_END=515 /DNA_ORIENTATION=-